MSLEVRLQRPIVPALPTSRRELDPTPPTVGGGLALRFYFKAVFGRPLQKKKKWIRTAMLADFLVPLRASSTPLLAPPPWGGAPSLPTTMRAFLSSKWTATLPVLWTRAPQWWPHGLNHCSLLWPRWPACPTFKADHPTATTFFGTSQSCFACPPKPLD
jgi:hypothetical protein